MSLNTSVIKYEVSFKLEDVKTTKMKTLNAAGRGDGYETCAEFERGGIELLLYVVEDFNLACDALNLFLTVELLEFWKKVLGHGPAEKWKRMLRNNIYLDDMVTVPAAKPGDMDIQQTVQGSGFNKMIADFIKLYCDDSDPKANLVAYIGSEECRKPKKVPVADHQERIEELI